MNIKHSLQLATTKFRKAKISSALLDAELILCFVLKKSKEYIFTYPEKNLTTNQAEKFRQLIAKRAKHFPIAYITNKKSFFGLDFFVNKNVLIPRPETETLVEEILNVYKLTAKSSKLVIADIGTGSGCIVISLAKNIPNAQFFAVDKSNKALAIAKKNAKTHKVNKKINFLCGNLLTPIKNKKIDILVANLPYVESNLKKILKNPESASLKYEPRTALVAGHDGLSIYKQLLQQIAALKIKPQFIFLEIGDRQAISIKKLIKKNLPEAQIEIIRDLCGRNRVAKITLNRS